jgi:hypothetical protein
MRTTFQTFVMLVPATPLGLLPERLVVEHWCRTCRQQVATADLAEHGRAHLADRGPVSDVDPSASRNDPPFGERTGLAYDSSLEQRGTGRPDGPGSTVRSLRATTEDVVVQVEMGSASSRGRRPDQSWMVSLRRSHRAVVVAIGLRRSGADSLAERIAGVLEVPFPGGT